MNNEVIKAMNKKPVSERKQAFRKWWSKNGYKVKRVAFFPVWGTLWVAEKAGKWLDSKNCWDPERANEIFSYFVPRRAHWDADKKEFHLSYNSFGWNLPSAKKYLKLKDRRFWCNNIGYNGGRMRTYLLECFELEGFEKIRGDCFDGWTEIIFKLIENGD